MELFSGQLGGLDRLLVLGAAILIEIAIGYPDLLYRRIGHPVTWIGTAIDRLEHLLNGKDHSAIARFFGGLATVLVILAIVVVPAVALEGSLSRTIFGLAVLAVITSSLVAARSLDRHVRDVADVFSADADPSDLTAAREKVSRIVGRDPRSLDQAGVCRAAIESLAENFSDGVTAPAFWFSVFGLPGAAAYKAINTADSMIGHKTTRHHAFGWVAARLDDIVNLPASRLSALLLIAAAAFRRDASAMAAVGAVWRDAQHHRSPNAGWPEAAMAGALDLSLSGPRTYDGKRVEDAVMGAGRREATPQDIHRALALYRTAVGLGLALLALLSAVLALASAA